MGVTPHCIEVLLVEEPLSCCFMVLQSRDGKRNCWKRDLWNNLERRLITKDGARLLKEFKGNDLILHKFPYFLEKKVALFSFFMKMWQVHSH